VPAGCVTRSIRCTTELSCSAFSDAKSGKPASCSGSGCTNAL